VGSVSGPEALLKLLVPFTPERTLPSGSIEPFAERFEFPYTYSDDKPRYSGQYLLSAAAALG
jgi:hypothetical protein